MAAAESATPELARPVEDPEEWRPVVGFEGLYEVSSLGRVRTMCWPGKYNWLTPRILKATPNKYGHLKVNLYRNKRQFSRTVHLLVAAAFLPPKPPGQECCHGPGGKTDNRAVNLSWGSRAKNMGPDKVRDGTDFRGERSPGAKLSTTDVENVRRRSAAGETGKSLAQEFGVSRGTISAILTGRNRRWDGAPSLVRPAYRGKLTDEDRETIRRRHAAGGLTYPMLAVEFGVTRECVGQVVRSGRAES